MKIVVCAKKDLAGCVALNRLLDGLLARHEVYVVLSDYVLDAECSNAYAASLVAHERNMVLEHILPWLAFQHFCGSSNSSRRVSKNQ